MFCYNCKFEISPSLKHAILKNECPACGSFIMDEETLTLIEDVKNTLLSEANLREEIAKNMSTTIVFKYNISFRDKNSIKNDYKPKENIKIAKPSIMKDIQENNKSIEKTEPNIIKSEEVNDISQSDREKIMEEVVKKRYNMIDGVYNSENRNVIGDDIEDITNTLPLFPDFDTNSILEQERLERLKRQKHVISGGGGGMFRRVGK